MTINELVCDVVSTSLGELKSCRVSLALELLDDLWPVVADRVQLQQVLLNLLTMHSTPWPRSQIARTCSMCVPSISTIACLSVSRIPAQGSIPSRLIVCSGHSSRPNQTAPAWVYPICRSIIEAHGGRLSVSPVHPHGSVFQVMLPAATKSVFHVILTCGERTPCDGF